MQKNYLLLVVAGMVICGQLFGTAWSADKHALSKNQHSLKPVAVPKSQAGLLQVKPTKLSGSLPQPEESLIKELKQIIDLLKQKLPSWNKYSLTGTRREKIIRAFVNSLGLSLKYSSDKYKHPKTNNKFKPLPLLWLANNRIAYVRIDAFNPEVILQFRQLHDILQVNYHLSGTIIDLRNCRSFDYDSGLACLQQLTKTYQTKAQGKLLLALLIGRHTIGTAEYFIHRLKTTFNPVVIGLQSAGQPFAYQEEKLPSNGYILYPLIPSAVRDTAIFTAQLPTIKVINNAQQVYPLQAQAPDVTVKYASQLLIALKATAGE